VIIKLFFPFSPTRYAPAQVNLTLINSTLNVQNPQYLSLILESKIIKATGYCRAEVSKGFNACLNVLRLMENSLQRPLFLLQTALPGLYLLLLVFKLLPVNLTINIEF